MPEVWESATFEVSQVHIGVWPRYLFSSKIDQLAEGETRERVG